MAKVWHKNLLKTVIFAKFDTSWKPCQPDGVHERQRFVAHVELRRLVHCYNTRLYQWACNNGL